MAKELKEIKIPRALDDRIKRFLELRKVLKEAEAEKAALQEALEPVLEDKPGRALVFGPVTLKLLTITVDRLDEKAAKEKLGEQLKPFYKPSSYNRINVS